MHLRELRYLATVAEHLHCGRAATALHVSRPASSKQIRALEQQLRVQSLRPVHGLTPSELFLAWRRDDDRALIRQLVEATKMSRRKRA